MVRYNNILKAIEEYITKCPATQKIRNMGAQRIVTREEELRYNKWGELDLVTFTKKIEYPNGITLHTDLTNGGKMIITGVTLDDGFNAELLGEDSFAFFYPQKDEIIKKYGEEGWEMMRQYTSAYASFEGKRFNLYKKLGLSKDWLFEQEKYGMNQSKTHYLFDNDDKFHEICNSLKLGDYPDFYSLRVGRLHENDGVNKRIVTTGNGHSSATVGENWDMLNILHKVDNTAWTIITVYKNGNNASTGFFMGNTDVGDIEQELHTGKKQKFERLIIDEEYKIIIQEPYEP